jgi:hypothetical protein
VEKTALAARFFDADLQSADLGAAKFLPNSVANPVGNMFRQKLGAGVR